jgi:2Fe-2S ferredoxin
MPKLTFLPNSELCPKGITVDAKKGDSICKIALDNGIKIEHACEMSCACTTCHVYINNGYDTLESPTDDEDDYLDKAWGLRPESRLSCQAKIADDDLVVEIPKYTINHASENH